MPFVPEVGVLESVAIEGTAKVKPDGTGIVTVIVPFELPTAFSNTSTNNSAV